MSIPNDNFFYGVLVLMCNGTACAKYFLIKSHIDYASEVVGRITGGKSDYSMFLWRSILLSLLICIIGLRLTVMFRMNI